RRLLQPILKLPLERIRVQYWEGSSTYGNSVARYDSGLAAAEMSQLAGAAVRLQFMRWDDHGWDNFGQAQLMDIRGGVDANGRIVGTDYVAYSIPFYSTDPTTQHTGTSPAVIPRTAAADTDDGTGTQYSLPSRRITTKVLPADRFF